MPTHNEALPHWVTELSDVEAEETSRKSRIAKHSNRIFDSLLKSFQEALAIYNERHPAQFEGPGAKISHNSDSGSFACQVFKLTQPRAELRVTFPLNEGLILYAQTFEGQAEKPSGVAEIEIGDAPDSPVTYNMNDHAYTEDEFVWKTLKDILFTQDVIVKAKKASSRVRFVG